MKHAPEDNTPEVDVQALVSRWADETNHLFLVLPRFLAESEERKLELQQLQKQVAELKQENERLRHDRAELADLLARFKQIIEGQASNDGAREMRAQVQAESPVTAASTTEGGARPTSIFSRVGHKS